jgi:hypothetical protein
MFTVIWNKSLFITSATICLPWGYRCSMREIWVNNGMCWPDYQCVSCVPVASHHGLGCIVIHFLGILSYKLATFVCFLSVRWRSSGVAGLWISNYYSFYFECAVSCSWWLWTLKRCKHPSFFGRITSNIPGAGLIVLGYGTKLAQMHLGLADRPFVPHVKSWESCCFAEAPDGPQV